MFKIRFTVLVAGLALAAGSAHADPVIDGVVNGFAEGYTDGWNVTLIDDDNTLLSNNATLYTAEIGNMFYAAFVAPLTVNDNTYGANKATDWGTEDHFLRGGGDGLDGSDKWEMKDIENANGDEFEIKLDYIEEDGGVFDTRIEKFKLDGSNLDQSKIMFKTSLAYNFVQSGNDVAYFDPDPADSPLASDGFYDFAAGVVWIPEITYEFKLDTTGLDWDSSNFLANLGTFHMSPNKLGKNKVLATLGDQISNVPEPSTLGLFGLGLVGLGLAARRRRTA